MGTHFNRLTGDTLEAFEDMIFQLLAVNKEKRKQDLRVEALNSAITYWKEALAKPDNSSDVIMLGRRRMTQINQRLEQLTPDSNQPNQP